MKDKIAEKLVSEARKGSLKSPRSIVFYILAILYVLSPVDIMPDTLLGAGQLDDAAILMGVGYYVYRLLRQKKQR